MPRGGRRSPSPSSSRRSVHTSRPAPAPAPQRSNVPAPAPPPPAAPMMAQPQQPSMMAQIATTAAGVAIGHTVGHALTGALSGGGSHDAPEAAAPAPQQQQYNEPRSQPGAGGACAFELRQFLDCAQNQHDLTLCDGFNDVLKQCKQSNGMSV